MGACGVNYIFIVHLFFFFGWPLQLSLTTFLFLNALSFSLATSLTFYLSIALPIFFIFYLPFVLATTKAFSFALPTFLGATCELQKGLFLLL
jgi:hypothetical protein